MVVALSILFAALVGGVVFVLLDRMYQREAKPAPAPQPARAWQPPRPEARTEPLPPRRVQEPEGSLWYGWSKRRGSLVLMRRGWEVLGYGGSGVTELMLGVRGCVGLMWAFGYGSWVGYAVCVGTDVYVRRLLRGGT